MGDTIRVCLQNGRWSGSTPTCVGKYIFDSLIGGREGEREGEGERGGGREKGRERKREEGRRKEGGRERERGGRKGGRGRVWWGVGEYACYHTQNFGKE